MESIPRRERASEMSICALVSEDPEIEFREKASEVSEGALGLRESFDP